MSSCKASRNAPAAKADPPSQGDLLRGTRGEIAEAQAGDSRPPPLRLAPQVFVRPRELRQAEWTEMDLHAAEWTIPMMQLLADYLDSLKQGGRLEYAL